MNLTLRIEINEEQIQALAQQACNQYLKVPDSWRGDQGGTGYIMIKRQVEAILNDVDYTDIIKEVAERSARGIIEDVTRETIKKIAKETTRKMKEEGSLL